MQNNDKLIMELKVAELKIITGIEDTKTRKK